MRGQGLQGIVDCLNEQGYFLIVRIINDYRLTVEDAYDLAISVGADLHAVIPFKAEANYLYGRNKF